MASNLKFDVAEPDRMCQVVPRDYAPDDIDDDDWRLNNSGVLSVLEEIIVGALTAIVAVGLVIALAFFFAFSWRVLREAGIDVWRVLSDLAASAWRRFS